jgi:hypothetical protein
LPSHSRNVLPLGFHLFQPHSLMTVTMFLPNTLPSFLTKKCRVCGQPYLKITCVCSVPMAFPPHSVSLHVYVSDKGIQIYNFHHLFTPKIQMHIYLSCIPFCISEVYWISPSYTFHLSDVSNSQMITPVLQVTLKKDFIKH